MSNFFDDADSAPLPAPAAAKPSFFDDADSKPIEPTGSANPLKWNEADWQRFKGFSDKTKFGSAINPENVYNALTHVDIPIAGPLVKRAAQAIIPKKYEDEQDAADAKFAAEHPGAKFVGQMIGGGMLPIKAPQVAAAPAGAGLLSRAVPAVANPLLRVATNSAVSAADADLRGEDAGEAAKNSALVSGGIEALIGGAKVAPAIAKKAANIFAGQREENVERYLENPPRVTANGAKTAEEVKQSLDDAVGAHLAERDQLHATADAAEQHLEDTYKGTKRDLTAVSPLAKAQEFSSALESTKSKLHSLSDEADDALVASGVTFEKQHLLDAIDQIGHGHKVAIGDEAVGALTKLQATRDRLAEQLDDTIDAKTLRTVLKQIRRDINFDQGSGEFNDTLTAMRKKFTGQMSGALKKAVPEYAEKMDEMSAIADNLGHMNRYFGTDAKALGSLEALRKGGAQAQLIEEALKNHAIANNDPSLINNASDLFAKRQILERMKNGEDLRGLLHPNETAAAQQARAAADAKQAQVAPFERLNPNRTYGAAKNIGFDNNATFLDKKAIAALDAVDNSSHGQATSDKALYESFNKEKPNGSRMSVIGSVTGGALGYMAGGPAGLAPGALAGGNVGVSIDKYGGRMVRTGLDKVDQISKAIPQGAKDAASAIGRNGIPAQFMPAITNGGDDGTSKVRQMLNDRVGVERLGKFAGPLQAAAARGKQGLAVAHFMLSQQEPEYAELMKANGP